MANFAGGPGDDIFNGGVEDETADGAGGNDTLNGGGGEDDLRGGAGNDTLIGGDGWDDLTGGNGADVLQGGDGLDIFILWAGDLAPGDSFDGGEGNDAISFQGGNWTNSQILTDISGLTLISVEYFGGASMIGVGMRIAQFSGFTQVYGSVRFTDGGTISLSGKEVREELTFFLTQASTFDARGSSLAGNGIGVVVLGSPGNDTIIDSNAWDVIWGKDGDDIVRGGLGGDGLYGDAGNDIVDGGAGDDEVSGGTGMDQVSGGEGDDIILVDAGTIAGSRIDGGSGNDRIEFRTNPSDQATVFDASDVDISGVETIYFHGAELVLRLEHLTGLTSLQSNSYQPGSVRFTTAGSLETQAFLRLDTIYLADGDNDIDLSRATIDGWLQVNGGSGRDTIAGAYGSVSTNLLSGGGGDDVLIGVGFDNILNGGTGDDVYLATTYDDINEYSGEGYDTVRTASASFHLADHVEALVYTGTRAFDGNGNTGDNLIDASLGSGADTLNGWGGNDTLIGGRGNDTLIGSAGDDLYVIGLADGVDVIVEEAGGGTDTVRTAQGTHVLAAHVERLIFTGTGAFGGTGSAQANIIEAGAGNDTLRGMAGDDQLFGLGGNDRLEGGFGADRMVGGAGDDRYLVDNLSDVIIELAGEGNDRVDSLASFSLAGQFIEMLVLGGLAAVNGTGNELANTIIGNSAANTLDGGAGADLLEGGKGDDVYVVDNAGDKVIEADGGGSDIVHSSVSFSLAGQFVEVVNLTGAAAINATGNGLANRLVGNGANNVLYGMDGNDRLDGGAGNDTMRGGLGNDVFVVDSAGDTVQENNGEGLDTVEAWISYSLAGQYIESLKLMGAAHINATGNGQANELIGNAGNNVLNGQQGADILRGGAGDDRLIVDHAGDKVFENANEGNDIVQSSVSFSIAGQHIEALVLTGTADIDGEGNSFANVITGNGGANLLIGGGGNDALHGGLGSDRLHGGAGQDGFWFDVDLNANNIDTIADFTAADDTIWLDRTIFTTVDEGALAAGAFATGTAAADADDRIVYDAATGNIWYDPDGVGGLAAGLFAVVTAGTALTAGDFVAVP